MIINIEMLLNIFFATNEQVYGQGYEYDISLDNPIVYERNLYILSYIRRMSSLRPDYDICLFIIIKNVKIYTKKCVFRCH